MDRQLLIYDRVAPVLRDQHRDLSLRPTDSFGFAAHVTHVPLLAGECAQAGAEMPIVFAAGDSGPITVALLGSQNGQNDFVTPAGKWDGRYVPAFLRRYPFVFSEDETGERLTLCIDEAYAGLNRDGVGERLFDTEGKETQYTRNVLRFVEEFHAGFVRTRALCKDLSDLGLLEQAQIDFAFPDGSKGKIDGFLRVSEARLRALDDASVLRLFRSGGLDLITLHLASLMRADALIARRRKTGAAA